MKRVIITGATGFVGANLARRMLRDGHQTHLLVRSGYASWRIEEIRAQVHIHEVDFGNAEALLQTVGKIQPDWVFHLATHGAYSTQTDLRQMIQTNFIGTVNLVEACLKVGVAAFVNTGSSSEYGFKDHAQTEQDWLEPNSHYAVTKASATLFCRYTAQSQGMCLPTLRLYSAFGPYEELSRLLPVLILHGLRGAYPPLVNPNVARDYVYVDDVVEAYLLAATQPAQEPGAVYNVGSGVQTSLRQVVEVAQQVLHIPGEPTWGSLPERSWDTDVWVANNAKIKSDLGWQPQYSFEQGFRRLVDWFERNPALRNFYS